MLPNVVVGAGLVGLAVARELQDREPDRPVIVLEKENGVGLHQSGNNSGVIHSGVYYAPGSMKAKMAVEGGRLLQRFCDEHQIHYDVPGKLVVATDDYQLGRLDALHARGVQNGVPARIAEQDELTEREPHLRATRALVVDSTGRVDYRDVTDALRRDFGHRGGEVRVGVHVSGVTAGRDGLPTIHAGEQSVAAHRVAVCAGLHSDRVARASGVDPGVRIIPFRGEFRTLTPAGADLVNGLVYPVPDPDLPFLGVHLTRGIDDTAHIGPNAVPAFAREGYNWRKWSARDLADMAAFPGVWRLGRKYAGTGAREILRSLSGGGLLKAAQVMLPELSADHLGEASAGVRAQAVARDGALVDDFLFARQGRVLHVLNAPSPAATACLVVGRVIADRLLGGEGG